MKLLKSALILSAFAAMLTFSGCTACDSMSSDISSEMSSVASEMSSAASSASSAPASEPSESMMSSSAASENASISEESSMVPTLSTDFAEIGALDGTPVTWGPGRQVDERNRPIACVQLQEQFGQYNCFFIGSKPGAIYLTFDEGYENGYTAQILDVLKEKDVKAIFFVTMPYVKSQPELVQRMIDEGHMVGNHSDKHPQGGYPTLPLDAAQKDLMSLHDYVKEQFDYDMTVFRYPEGAFSPQTAALVGETGYKQLFWSFAYKDYDVNAQPDRQTAYDRVINAAHDGAIYLLHAVSKTNTEILPDVIDALREKGFTFELFQETATDNSANDASAPTQS